MRIHFGLFVVLVLQLAASVDAGTRPTSRPASLLADPARFPIAVWLQSPRNAAKYQSIGINLYVGLWNGPTAEQLSALEKAGMPVICMQNAEGLKPRWQREIVGWMLDDEPDNAQSLGQGKGYGPPITPQAVLERYKAVKANDAGRPVLLNLGQGVAWDGWYGRGVRSNHPEDYPQYVLAGDIVSFDIYPAVHDRKEVAGKLWYVGRGTQRLAQWADGARPEGQKPVGQKPAGHKPVWTCIECTHISNAAVKPTPEQVRAEVWMAIIHGARGIVYFSHQFEPRFVEAGLLEDAQMMAAVGRLNGQIQELAPIINSAEPAELAKVQSAPQAPVAIMTRRQGSEAVVFAVGMSEATTKATFSLGGATGRVEVIGEGRTLEAEDGTWTDEFRGYEAHVYRAARASAAAGAN